ncbi:MAG: hypothetical protein E4H14_04585 [Candidatus Thorarchaeota archaeon]|nr:MAG: hypothetical protein E4H14_04585 [Candidatus Thorarchaeota archaeon]
MMILERTAGNHTIYLEVKEIGKDLLISIHGGDEHHIGGVAIAYITPSHYRDASTVSLSSLTFPGHKDYVVANSTAEKVCKALERATVVTAGIHYDNATKNDIDGILKAVEELVDELLLQYAKAE